MLRMTFLAFLQVIIISGAMANGAVKDINYSNEQRLYIANHKPLAFFKAVVCGDKVRLTFCRGNWYYKNSAYDDLYKNIVIYRKQVDFIFGKDHKEAFDELTCSGADLIYNGHIKPEQGRNFTYYDTTVSTGQTYAYWVGVEGSQPTGPYPIKVRDANIWWPQDKISQELYNLQKAYPDIVKVSVIGKTVKGKEILGVVVGQSNKKVALVGAIHASESGSELIIPAIKNLLENHKDIFNKVSVIVVPCINLDERQAAVEGVPWYLRRNTISVDLNRNFPGDWQIADFKYGSSTVDPNSGTYRGPSPASEPETQAVVSFLKLQKPSVLLSYHHLASVTGRCFWAPAAAKNDKAYAKKCREVYDAYTQGYCDGFADEKPQEDWLKFAATPGSIPVWCYRELGIPGFDVERHTGIEKSLTDETDSAMLMRNQQQHTSALLNLLKTLAEQPSADITDSNSMWPYAKETPEQRDARMEWWKEARFGMFIHWGIYSVLGGTYQGKEGSRNGEWIMYSLDIPVAAYKEYAKQFNPVKYDPEKWVLLAKEAGMKYIVITAKHHDGFALFDSKADDWDVVDSTPYGKDLLKTLAEACRKHNMKLGFYYSQAQDWCHRGGAIGPSDKKGKKPWDKSQKGDMDKYLRTIAVPQVKEILSNYGDVAVIWWDTPKGMTKKRADTLLPLMSLQPNIIINSRLGGEYKGDFDTPEQKIPATGLEYDWETCMTMNDTWGYKSNDNDWKSVEKLIQNLVDIASKGGNYLLNVGPTPEGEIPAASVERLEKIGKWLKVNGESVYATDASPFKEQLPWGRCTQKIKDGKTVLYLHIFKWPADGKLLVPSLQSKVENAYLLAGEQKLKTYLSEDGLIIDLPQEMPDKIDTVAVLSINGMRTIQDALK